MSDPRLPGPLDLEIDLLLGMRCDEKLKLAKLRELGITYDSAKKIAENVAQYIRFGRQQFENSRLILGVDATQEENPSLTYRLTLWPDFDFVVKSESGLWWMARFVRAADSPKPDLSSPADLAPWTACIQDFEEEFDSLRCTDAFPPWEEFVFETSTGTSYGADFSYGLLQQIEAMPTNTAPGR